MVSVGKKFGEQPSWLILSWGFSWARTEVFTGVLSQLKTWWSSRVPWWLTHMDGDLVPAVDKTSHFPSRAAWATSQHHGWLLPAWELRGEAEATVPCLNWPQESLTATLTSLSCLPRAALIQCEEKPPKGVGVRRQKSLGAVWETGHHTHFAFGRWPCLNLSFSKFSPTFNTHIKASIKLSA